MAPLDELIGSWTLGLRAANRAPRTVAQYVDESLAQFRRWMAEHEADLAPAADTGMRRDELVGLRQADVDVVGHVAVVLVREGPPGAGLPLGDRTAVAPRPLPARARGPPAR